MNSRIAESVIGTIKYHDRDKGEYSVSLNIPDPEESVVCSPERVIPANPDFPELQQGDMLEFIVLSEIQETDGKRIITPGAIYGARFAARQADLSRVYYDAHDKFPGSDSRPQIAAARALLTR